MNSVNVWERREAYSIFDEEISILHGVSGVRTAAITYYNISRVYLKKKLNFILENKER